VSMATNSGAGLLGLFSYTSAGIAKSLRAAVYTKTRKSIAQARHAEGKWMAKKSINDGDEIERILAKFEALRTKKAKQ
jgi:hypothetical protein